MNLLNLAGVPAAGFQLYPHALPLAFGKDLTTSPGPAGTGGIQILGLQESIGLSRLPLAQVLARGMAFWMAVHHA